MAQILISQGELSTKKEKQNQPISNLYIIFKIHLHANTIQPECIGYVMVTSRSSILDSNTDREIVPSSMINYMLSIIMANSLPVPVLCVDAIASNANIAV